MILTSIPGRRAVPRIARWMLERAQVLHVARLARLQLSESEVERMAAELSKVLDHVEKIRELDLDGVPPTSHVIDVRGAPRGRAPACLPVEVVLEQAPEPVETPAGKGFGVPAAREGPRSVNELLNLTAAAAAAAIRAGELSSESCSAAYRERAAADELNAFTWVAEGPAVTARAATPRSAAYPSPSRTCSARAGIPSQAGSRILEGYRPPYTATVVTKLNESGAPLIGKTNQDEFAMGSSNENSGFGPVLNPWDRGRVPGGSSGGSAAAVAAGLAPWAIGTDTGGSIRQPAALCGIVGVKPTYGACSRYGMIAFASSLDQAGPLTRDVTDAALLLGQMIGRDPCDSTSLEFPGQIETAERSGPRRGCGSAFPRSWPAPKAGSRPACASSSTGP